MKTCVLSIIKDEQQYLDEWIRYHLQTGIDTLFIFEDVGSESHKDICGKYPQVTLQSILDIFPESKDEIIELKENGRFIQGKYYARALQWIKDNHDIDWTFLLDADEFLTPTEAFPGLLTAYQEYDGVLVYWKNFGASGHIRKPLYDKPTWETFSQECSYTEEDWRHRNISKMCFNMKRFKKSFVFGGHTAICNWVRTDFKTSRMDSPTFDKMYIRHYMTRSWEEYKWKIEKRGDICPNHRKINDFFEMNKSMIEIKDDLINGKY